MINNENGTNKKTKWMKAALGVLVPFGRYIIYYENYWKILKIHLISSNISMLFPYVFH